MFFEVSGGQKESFFGYVFFSVRNDALFEIVKKQLVFIAFSPMCFLNLWQKIIIFLSFDGRLSRTTPNRKCCYFVIRMQNSPPKKVFLVIFRGGPQGSQNGFKTTLLSKIPFGLFLFFFMKILIFRQTSEKWWFFCAISIVKTLRFKCENHVYLCFTFVL